MSLAAHQPIKAQDATKRTSSYCHCKFVPRTFKKLDPISPAADVISGKWMKQNLNNRTVSMTETIFGPKVSATKL
jgi:hypothetical protein